MNEINSIIDIKQYGKIKIKLAEVMDRKVASTTYTKDGFEI